MQRAILLGSAAACLVLGLGVSQIAAQTTVAPTAQTTTPATAVPAAAPAQQGEACLGDLRAFDSAMEKDGYWLGGAGYGYGYPVGGCAGGVGFGFHNARPGYQVRTLVTAANILARHGQQEACEAVLTTTREIYARYAAAMRSGKVPKADVLGWRHQQIAAAKSVAATDTAFRADQLLGTDIRNARNEALGSVDDLIMRPQTGKIAYLIVARGGIFGIGETYVPIPWAAFKVTPNSNLLVLAASKAAMDAAP